MNGISILNETTVTAIAYGFRKNVNGLGEKNVWIFDPGGGIFDMSLLSIKKSILEWEVTAEDAFTIRR